MLHISLARNMIKQSLLTGYIPQAFKVAVAKPLLKKPLTDPSVLVNRQLVIIFF